jgi:hypothetical protein
VSGDIDEIVGLVSPTVTLPPKTTGLPLIVILLFTNLSLAIEPAKSALEIVASTIFRTSN